MGARYGDHMNIWNKEIRGIYSEIKYKSRWKKYLCRCPLPKFWKVGNKYEYKRHSRGFIGLVWMLSKHVRDFRGRFWELYKRRLPLGDINYSCSIQVFRNVQNNVHREINWIIKSIQTGVFSFAPNLDRNIPYMKNYKLLD